MAAPVFTDEELEGLRRFPEIGREELYRFFTLTQSDIAFVDPRRGRGPTERLGLAVTLCTLPWLGFVPDEVSAAPGAAVARLASQLAVDRDAIRAYGRRAKTRTDHLRLAAQYLGWRQPGEPELKELDEFLPERRGSLTPISLPSHIRPIFPGHYGNPPFDTRQSARDPQPGSQLIWQCGPSAAYLHA